MDARLDDSLPQRDWRSPSVSTTKPWNRLPERRVKRIKQLRAEGFSIRRIAAIMDLSTTTVFKYSQNSTGRGVENSND